MERRERNGIFMIFFFVVVDHEEMSFTVDA